MLPFEQFSDTIALKGLVRPPKSRALKHDPSRNEELRPRIAPHADTVRAALGVSPALKVHVFDAAEAAVHETAWLDLATRALEPNIFFEPAVALAAAQHLSEAGQPSFVFVFEAGSSEQRLVGVFPFTRSRLDIGAPLLRSWQHAYNPIGTPLLDAKMADAALTAFFEHMETTPCRFWSFANIAENGAFLEVLKRVVMRRSGQISLLRRQFRALLRSGSDPHTSVEAQWRPKKLKELRRLRRKLEDGGPVTFRSARAPVEANEALERFFALEASGWKGRSGTALVQDAGRATFVRSMLRELSLTGKVRIEGLYVADAMVAGAISLISGGTAAFWKIAYDEAYAKLSPGVLLTQDMTRAFLADPSLTFVDSCALQDHPMIDHLWHERRAMVDGLCSMTARPALLFHFASIRETLWLSGRQGAKQAVLWIKAQRRRIKARLQSAGGSAS